MVCRAEIPAISQWSTEIYLIKIHRVLAGTKILEVDIIHSLALPWIRFTDLSNLRRKYSTE